MNTVVAHDGSYRSERIIDDLAQLIVDAIDWLNSTLTVTDEEKAAATNDIAEWKRQIESLKKGFGMVLESDRQHWNDADMRVTITGIRP